MIKAAHSDIFLSSTLLQANVFR